jgi:hypothetical protein
MLIHVFKEDVHMSSLIFYFPLNSEGDNILYYNINCVFCDLTF